MTPEVKTTVFNKIILNVWIENVPAELYYGLGIELAFRSNSYVLVFITRNICDHCLPESILYVRNETWLNFTGNYTPHLVLALPPPLKSTLCTCTGDVGACSGYVVLLFVCC
jgi:hypothetical protein